MALLLNWLDIMILYRLFILTLTAVCAFGWLRRGYQAKMPKILQELEKCCNYKKALASLCLISSTFTSYPLPSQAIDGTSQQNEVSGVGIDEKVSLDSELTSIFAKARQAEMSGDFDIAKKLYEEIIEAEPNYLFGWANLGNVLTVQGNLNDALLCYRKALTLRPPRNDLGTILLNKAVVEMALGFNNQALTDLQYSEKMLGSTSEIVTNKAVVSSRLGMWEDSCRLFDSVMSRAERNAQPWWLRYSMALEESGRSTEAVAILQRVLNRFPEEPEVNAYATSLYSLLNDRKDAVNYWSKLSTEEQNKYKQQEFLKSTVVWGPKALSGMQKFSQK